MARALDLDPTLAGAHLSLGAIAYESRDYAAAAANYRSAAAFAPGNAEAHVNLANALFQQGLTAEAIEPYRRALALQPGDVSAHANLGLALALVVMFTNRAAFFSPLAVVVVAAIGLAAVLLQLRFYNREHSNPVHAPVSLNIVGIVFALAALLGDVIRLGPQLAQVMALLAVGCFAISSAIVLHAFRKQRTASK
jgi:tetratricopeptide (TPR) repeat protein